MIEAIREWLLSCLPWGTEVIVWAQSFSCPPLDALFAAGCFMGGEEFFIVVLPVLFWSVSKRAGRLLAYALLLSVYVNSLIKHVFLTPRPFDPRVQVMRPVDPPNPNFPSGHAQNGTVVFGFLASRLRRTWAWIVAVLLSLFVGLSRIYVGVHDPCAVVGGLLLGALFLALSLWLLPRAETWLGGQPLYLKLALAILLPIVGMVMHQADVRGLYPAPDAATAMGALLGMSVGFLLEPRWVGFSVKGTWWQRLLRSLVGFLVVAVFWLGLRTITPQWLSHAVQMTLRFVRYALSGLAAILLAPWLFVRLRLAESELGR